MKEVIENQLIKCGWKKGQKLLLAVSGGVDSMLLWHIIHELKIDYAVAHVNFQLRGDESNLDQNLIENVAKSRKAKLFLLQANTTEYSENNAVSIQMAAREIRYTWFEELKAKHNLNFLCTAHHLNDSIETFFINLDRGTGIRGLSGISSTNHILRPLLSFTKEEIRNYCESKGIQYREDQSNQSNKYKRNWLRNTIIEDWKKRNPSFEKTMAKNLNRFAKAEKVYLKAIQNDLKTIQEELINGYFLTKTAKQLEFPKESLFELLNKYGFTESQIQNLETGITNNQVGFRLSAANYELNLDREKVFIREKMVESKESEAIVFKYQNSIETPIQLRFDLISKSDLTYADNSKLEFFDFDKLPFPIKVRKWQKGDKMKPLGLKGQKKISDILVDSKVPLIEKENCWVLESNQKVVWLVGYKVSEEFKIDSTTKQVLKIQLIPKNEA